MNVYIRFVKSGALKVQTPPEFDTMSIEEKKQWAFSILQGATDKELLDSMRDHVQNFFDETPEVEAIENEEGNPTALFMSDLWKKFIGM
jgi:hypothetical protein